MVFFSIDHLLGRAAPRTLEKRPYATMDEVYRQDHTMMFPETLINVIQEEAEHEQDEVRQSRWNAIDGVVKPLCSRYGLRGSPRGDGGFLSSSGELRFIMGNEQNGSTQFVYGFKVIGAEPHSPAYKELLSFSLEYINGLMKLYAQKPWKK